MKFVVITTLLVITLAACGGHRTSFDDFGVVPEYRLTAQDGQPFDSRTLQGKIWVADFIYTTCPGPCPRMTSQMHDVQNAILAMPDVKLVSFTIDPGHDTPPVLAEYAKVHGASSAKWYFLTGPVPTLQMLDRDAFKLGNVDATLEHSTRFVLVDRNGHIRRYYDTTEPDSISRLISDIRDLASQRS